MIITFCLPSLPRFSDQAPPHFCLTLQLMRLKPIHCCRQVPNLCFPQLANCFQCEYHRAADLVQPTPHNQLQVKHLFIARLIVLSLKLSLKPYSYYQQKDYHFAHITQTASWPPILHFYHKLQKHVKLYVCRSPTPLVFRQLAPLKAKVTHELVSHDLIPSQHEADLYPKVGLCLGYQPKHHVVLNS